MPTKKELENKDRETLNVLINYLNCNEDVAKFKRKRSFVFNFSLLWNLFEDQCMNNFAKISDVDAFVENLSIPQNSSIVDEIYLYMRNRYVLDFDAEARFFHLLWRSTSSEQQIRTITKNILSNSTSPIKDKIKAILYVIFRLRNNLFHGEKDIIAINAQQETFVLVNRFLMDLIKMGRMS